MWYNIYSSTEKLNILRRDGVEYMTGYAWLFLAIVFGVLEAATVQLVSVWFAGGAVAALIAYMLGAGTAVQIAVFAVTSVILLILTRPLMRRLTKNKKISTNAETLIGKTAVVTQKTDELGLSGQAKVCGAVWTICSADGTPIEENEKVTVEKIEGVKLIVRK